jgi:hypothetical protein
MLNMLDAIIGQWERELKEGGTEVKIYPNAKLAQSSCKVIVTTHPQPRQQPPFYQTYLYIDKLNDLPIRVEQHGFPTRPGEKPPLLEEYNYTNLKINVGMTKLDFDPRNRAYRFN